MEIQKKTSREHILERPSMYIGGTDMVSVNDYVLNNDKIERVQIQYIPALLKLINEIIDNSIDIAIKTNFEICNLISVTIGDEFIEIKDNGPGIPVKKNSDNEYLPFVCWGYAMSGSNFDDDENRKHLGMNGVGSYCVNVWSTKFTGISDDGNKRYEITFKNNASAYVDTVKKTVSRGVSVRFYPDLKRFGIEKIGHVYQQIIQLRLINLNVCFPKINFILNNEKIKIKKFKDYLNFYNDINELFETENIKIGILPSNEFEHYSFVNGLFTKDGGTHIDYISDSITEYLKDKLSKKYKEIKKSDIKNKLFFIVFITNFSNSKFNSQTKEKLTNSLGEVSTFIGDLELLSKHVYNNEELINPIIDLFKIKEEYKRKQELKKLDKPAKRIKSDKYFPATKLSKYLMICEGESALGSLMPAFGLSECGYYVLKGKPLNVWNVTQQKFTANKELSELYRIIKNEDYHYIVIASDEDLDGIHIRALLCTFIHKYLPNYEYKVGFLKTPIVAVFKNDRIQRWSYSLEQKIKCGKTEKSFYFKGLGSWEKDDLKHVIETDGLKKMIVMINFKNADVAIDEWMGNDSSIRKKYILDNDFKIADV